LWYFASLLAPQFIFLEKGAIKGRCGSSNRTVAFPIIIIIDNKKKDRQTFAINRLRATHTFHECNWNSESGRASLLFFCPFSRSSRVINHVAFLIWNNLYYALTQHPWLFWRGSNADGWKPDKHSPGTKRYAGHGHE